jgi:hypothetical protein
MFQEEKTLRKFVLFVLLLLLVLMLAANLSATIINFDDLPGDGVVPDGYAGVTWYGEWNYYGEAQDPYNPHSPPNRVYDFLNDAHFTFGSGVTFDGAWFAGPPDTTVQFQGYLGGVLQFTSAMINMSSTPTFLSSGYAGLVDDIHVLTNAPDFFIMDDVTYNGGGGVPEPGTLVLLGSGALGLAGYIRRKF